MYLAHPITLGAGAVFLIAGILLYRRRGKDAPGQGSQGAVILLIVGLILTIHGLGLLEYRPSGSGR
jgi:hypothetical protein